MQFIVMWKITPATLQKNASPFLCNFFTDGRICSKIKVTTIKIQVLNRGHVLNLTSSCQLVC